MHVMVICRTSTQQQRDKQSIHCKLYRCTFPSVGNPPPPPAALQGRTLQSYMYSVCYSCTLQHHLIINQMKLTFFSHMSNYYTCSNSYMLERIILESSLCTLACLFCSLLVLTGLVAIQSIFFLPFLTIISLYDRRTKKQNYTVYVRACLSLYQAGPQPPVPSLFIYWTLLIFQQLPF